MLLRTGLRWIAILAAFAATAEVFVRIDETMTWGAPLLGPYSEELLVMRDSLGTRGRPTFRFRKWRMNNAGFRGSDISPLARPGTTRIAILGASETFGLYETEGMEYPVQLQSALDSMAPGRFEVVNAALAGMNLSTMVGYYQQIVAPIRPGLVLIYPSPSFYLEVDAPTLRTRQPNGSIRQPGTPPTKAEPAAGPVSLAAFYRALWPPRLAGKSREVLKEVVPSAVVVWSRELALARARARESPSWVWQSVPEDRMAILAGELGELVSAIRSSGAQVAVVTHTNRFVGEGAAVTSQNRRHLTNLISQYYPRASEQVLVALDSVANDVVRRVARDQGIPVLEVEGRVRPTSENFADYAHFTNAGARVMARLLAAGVIGIEGLAPAQGPAAAVLNPPGRRP